jgi:hypothetical protein
MCFILKNKKIYVCHVNNCKYNDQGSCNLNQDSVVITLYDGVAQCPNYTPVDRKDVLTEALLSEIADILIELGEDDIVKDLPTYELCTDAEGICYIHGQGNNVLQDFCMDERVAALIDALNVVNIGKPSKAVAID